MRRIAIGNHSPNASQDQINGWVNRALRIIEAASRENDTSEIADSYTLSNFTITRTLDASTATTADIANVLATLLYDMQNRGVSKG